MSATDEPADNGRGDLTPSEPALTPDAGNSVDDLGDNDADLFGDDDDDAPQQSIPHRKLDDSDLDSGDDEGRNDRLHGTVEDDYGQEKIETIANIARVNYPEGEDLYLLNIPPFLAVKHRNFDYDTYEVPTRPHDGDEQRKFSPFSTAMTTMFWRHDPKDSDLLQSNARIIKWSDGSMTLQLATKPNEQYRIEPKGVRQSYNAKHSKQPVPAHYDPSKDSHMFLAASHTEEGVQLQLVRPIDATMRILPSGDLANESVQRLKASLAAVKETHDPLARLKMIEEDPEIAKKAAEAFEKEKARTQRKREAAEDRLLVRRDRVLGRSGFGGGRSGAGLSVAGLEDDDGMPSTYGKSAKRRKTTNRRGEIYSDDEDPDIPRREKDEYDREDDFLASSDEEPEVYDDGEEEVLDNDDDPDRDDLEIEGRETVIENRTRGDKGRRQRMDEIEDLGDGDDDDDDAEAEEDTELLARQNLQASPQQGGAGGRKRRVIDDDDDDDGE